MPVMNAEAYARKVALCSARGPGLADMLSKGLEKDFRALWMEEEGVELVESSDTVKDFWTFQALKTIELNFSDT